MRYGIVIDLLIEYASSLWWGFFNVPIDNALGMLYSVLNAVLMILGIAV